MAATLNFLPGIAERLGDPSFTKGLALREAALVRFMEEPREHLIDTINALDDAPRAALLLVYVHQGAFDQAAPDTTAVEAVTELTGVRLAQIHDCFPDLQGSFMRRPGPGSQVWTFAHPTIADALTDILRENSLMAPALVRGATIDTILRGFICEGVSGTKDAMVVPASLNVPLVRRLVSTPDETERNWELFSFLAYRASDDVMRLTVQGAPGLLQRSTWSTEEVNNNPRINALGRVHYLGLLPGHLRDEAADILVRAALNFDLSYFDDEGLLALIPPAGLVALGVKLRGQTLPAIEEKISDISDEADLDEDADGLFDRVRDALTQFERMTDDDQAVDLIRSARQRVSREIRALAERKEERDREAEEDHTDWGELLNQVSRNAELAPTPSADDRPRSIFEDVDQLESPAMIYPRE